MGVLIINIYGRFHLDMALVKIAIFYLDGKWTSKWTDWLKRASRWRCCYPNIIVEKCGEHAPGTAKVFFRSTWGEKLSTRCLDSISSHMFCGNSSIYQYFPSSACSIVLWCPIVQKPWVRITLQLEEYVSKNSGTGRSPTFERLSTFFSSAKYMVQQPNNLEDII